MQENSLQAGQCRQGNPLLESHLPLFSTSLLDDGYAEETVHDKLSLLSCLGQWLTRTGRAVTHLDERLVKAFVKQRQRVQGGDLKTLQQFLDYLREIGVVPAQEPVCDRSALADILSRYDQYLRSERGLIVATISNYQYFVRKFLTTRFREGPFLLKAMKASDISDFVLRYSHSMGVSRARLMTTAFRSFFRYLFQKGELQADLAAAVPTVANWRLSTVPKYLAAEEVKRVLQSCDRRTATGRRDYAILLLLARLGLRAGEVVALQLEDINWRVGEILVRGKGLVHDRMPLPADVGEALASYLCRSRPACQARRVFVRIRAPRLGLAGPSTVTAIVYRALARADLHPPSKGAHLLRHSLATSMLRAGATMGEIGEVLRHRDSNTTDLYAKVDFDGLRSLAHPWPTGGAQ